MCASRPNAPVITLVPSVHETEIRRRAFGIDATTPGSGGHRVTAGNTCSQSRRDCEITLGRHAPGRCCTGARQSEPELRKSNECGPKEMTQKQLVLVEIIPIKPMNMKRAGWQSDNGKNAAESLFPIDLRISI